MSDMKVDIFVDTNYGKAALRKLSKLGKLPENFRLYSACLVGTDEGTIKVDGAEFRLAKSGPNKGSLSILIKGTEKTVYVSC